MKKALLHPAACSIRNAIQRHTVFSYTAYVVQAHAL